MANSLSKLRTGEHYDHNVPLHNTEPIILKKKAEVNMVTTCAKSEEEEKLTPKLPDLQIRVRDIFKTLDKCQLIMNAEKVLEPGICKTERASGQRLVHRQPEKFQKAKCDSVIADKNNILRMKVDHKGDTLESILLPKVLRLWIIASMHKFCRQQGGDWCYYRIRATYLEWHEKRHFPSHLKL